MRLSEGTTRRHLLIETSRLGLLAALVPPMAFGACAASEIAAEDEPWRDGGLWSDGSGWRP